MRNQPSWLIGAQWFVAIRYWPSWLIRLQPTSDRSRATEGSCTTAYHWEVEQLSKRLESTKKTQQFKSLYLLCLLCVSLSCFPTSTCGLSRLRAKNFASLVCTRVFLIASKASPPPPPPPPHSPLSLCSKPRLVVWRRIVRQLPARDDGKRVEMRVGGEIVGLDVVKVDGSRDLWHLCGSERGVSRLDEPHHI